MTACYRAFIYKTMATAVKIAVLEYERGWGSKIDDWMVCESVKDALEFKQEFNAKNTEKTAPDWYMVCDGEPKQIDLNDKQFEVLKSNGKQWLSFLNAL